MSETSPRNADRSIESFVQSTTAPLIELSLNLEGVVPDEAAPILVDSEYGITGRAVEIALRKNAHSDMTECFIERRRPGRLAYLDLAQTVCEWTFWLLEAEHTKHRWHIQATTNLAGVIQQRLECGAEVYFPAKSRYLRLRDMRARRLAAE